MFTTTFDIRYSLFDIIQTFKHSKLQYIEQRMSNVEQRTANIEYLISNVEQPISNDEYRISSKIHGVRKVLIPLN